MGIYLFSLAGGELNPHISPPFEGGGLRRG